MKINPAMHHRQTTRLRHWDYSWGWWYYVTICVKEKRCDFGHVENDAIVLSNLGKTAKEFWIQIPLHHDGVELDDYVVMPNHLHGILILNDDSRRDLQLNVPATERSQLFNSKKEAMAALSPKKGSLSVIVRTFKAAVTMWARGNRYQNFAWQARFYEHIIRNDADLTRIRTYIANNPLRWSLDEENPASIA
jgi:putative transposase